MITAQTDTNSDNIPVPTPQKSTFDTVIVFGQGPIKPVLLEKETTDEQLSSWKAYSADPFRHKEPGFWLVQQPKHLQQIEKIHEAEKITAEEKERLIELKRQEWQRVGWYATKTIGRQNALAAGYALYKGLTKKIIFTGGRTISQKFKEILPKQRIDSWPSEAALMKDIVLSHYGDMYEKKFGKMIDEVVLVEDAATNTLENISFVLNKYPDLLEGDTRIGYLSARHHLRRIKLLTSLFSLKCEEENQLLSAQELVKQAHTAVVDASDGEVNHVDEMNYLDVRMQSDREERWRRGLNEPEYVAYWLGYLGDVKYPLLIQKTLKRLTEEPWNNHTSKALAKVGVNFAEYRSLDLCTLAKNNPEKYLYLVNSLQKLKSTEHRKFPSVEIPA